MGGERRLDLSRLDAEAADLDLLVVAPQELEVAVRPVAGEVAGAVEPLPGTAPRIGGDDRIGDEALGGLLGAAEIAPRQAGAADVELRRHARGDRPEGLVEQMDAGVGDRPADGRQRGPARRRAGQAEGGGDVALRGAVLVPELRGGQAGEQLGDGSRSTELLAGGHHLAQRVREAPPLDRGLGELLQSDEWQEEALDLLAHQGFEQGHGVEPHRLRDQHHGAPCRPGAEQLLVGDVEAQGGELQGLRARP